MPSIEGSPEPAALPPDLQPPPLPCVNCGATLHGVYCAQCGQHVADFHRSLWRLIGDFCDSVFCWDNKLLRTLGPLLTAPGLLTQEFVVGHRVRYVQPLRLFLFVSAVCLTLLQLDHSNWLQLRFDPVNRHKAPASANRPAASAHDAAAAGTSLDDRIDQAVATRLKSVSQDRLRRQIYSGLQQRLEWVALVLLPFFALLLRMVYWQRDAFYFDHLVFSLHYHTFLFLFWTVYIGCKLMTAEFFLLSWLTPLTWLLLLLPPVYLFVGLRRVYGGGAQRTFWKISLIGSIHLLALFLGVTVTTLHEVLTPPI